MLKVTLATWATWDELIVCILATRLKYLWPQIWETIDDQKKSALHHEATVIATEICQDRMRQGKYSSLEEMDADLESETELQKMLKFL